MEFFNVGLLVAVATPVVVVVVMNVLLAMGGENGTLLFPSLRGYPTVLDPQLLAVAAPDAKVQPAVRVVPSPVNAGYDESDELLARQAA
jgi:hypothetical protein